MSLNGKPQEQVAVERGKVLFNQTCFACHGMDGKGNQAMGAPDLTNNNWLYGGSRVAVGDTIAKGRTGIMPAFNDRLGEDKVHILAGYIYSLSMDKK
jgi:cytochrome c oxidase cbb3-type subunit 3